MTITSKKKLNHYRTQVKAKDPSQPALVIEPMIKIATPMSRLQVTLVQDALRDTGWKHSDHFYGSPTPSGVRPTYKMIVFHAKEGLKRSEVLSLLKETVGKFTEEAVVAPPRRKRASAARKA